MYMRILVVMLSALLLGSLQVANAARSEHVNAAVTQADHAKININKADAATLESVKGIGAKKAEAIVAYREQHGAFKSIQDLTQVKGIGEKKLAKISQYLTV